MKSMKPDQIMHFLKRFRPLANFWPAGLVILTILLTMPKTIPLLKKIPERLIVTEVDAAEEKPPLPEPAKAPEEALPADSGNTYTDGVYKGSARGYGGMITVQVTVAEKKIAEVSVLSAPGETGSFLSKAKGVIDRVIQAQTWEVDVVSGATYSSRGILGAVRNALTGETVENAKPPAQPQPKAPLTQQPFDDSAVWKDGTYIGSAMGFGGTIKVEVTIKGGKIDSIRVLQHSGETDSYFNKAKRVIKKIISAGTPNVDTISGATYSSNGIINAVKNALKKASGKSTDDSAQEEPPKTPAKTPARDDTEEPDLQNGLKDGTYSVDVDCTDGRIFDYTIRITMVVKDGKIRSIQAKRTDDRSDNPEQNEIYLGYAVNGQTVDARTWKSVISQILEKQSTKGVDTVSGATWSSQAILRGVKKLLAQAANDKSQAEEDGDEDDGQETGRKPGSGEPDPGTEPEEDPQDEPDPADGLEDGTYSMEAVCTDDPEDPLFDYTVLVTMEVKNGEIISLTAEITEDRSDDPSTNSTYFNYALEGRTRKGVTWKGVIAQILDSQSAKDIDSVSGATWSSKTIINTVKKLLRQAAKDPDGEDEPGEGTGPAGEDEPGEGTGPAGEDEPGEGTDPSGEDKPGEGTDPSGEDGQGGNNSDNSGTGSSGSEEGSSTGGSSEGSETGSTGGEGSEESGTGSSGSGEGSSTGGSSEGGETGSTGDSAGSGKTDSETGAGSGGQDDGGNQGDAGEDNKEIKPYLDGTYTAKASCTDDPDDPFFSYTIKVTVTVKDGKITKVRAERTDDESEDPDENDYYMDYAVNGRTRKGKTYPGIPQQVLDSQNASGLDTVSGATYSSKALIRAVKEALEDAKNPDA